ncbi:sulfite exporter TauE/SafE family protein [Flexistipes sinusarabici]|uniref:Probable membrane transporter protein n=1 Tax=Flexistipes sinusarabici TaxID=2352 RepID=A0A3D5Q9R3_FLESI|nr:TSUP family transporter [Flexistipes sinusarabici]HCW92595.1 integrase [Flexistipes sinusarabici]
MLEIMLFLIGILSGFVNILAGGGSFLTIPILIFMGLPPTVANGTNRLGIFLQSLIGAVKFKQYGVFPAKFALIVSIPAIAGSIIGSYLATVISDEAFKNYLVFFMVAITLITLFNPVGKLKQKDISLSRGKWVFSIIAFFFVGIYGGFIQAGVGFLILAAIIVTGYDLVSGNAVKTFVILIFTIFALAIFFIQGKVNLYLGLILSIGNVIGALAGTKVTVLKGNNFIRWFVVICVLIFAIKLIFF